MRIKQLLYLSPKKKLMKAGNAGTRSRLGPGFLRVPPAHLVYQSVLSGLKNSLRTGELRWQKAQCG